MNICGLFTEKDLYKIVNSAYVLGISPDEVPQFIHGIIEMPDTASDSTQ